MTALKTKSKKQWIRKIKIKGIIVILKITYLSYSFLFEKYEGRSTQPSSLFCSPTDVRSQTKWVAYDSPYSTPIAVIKATTLGYTEKETELTCLCWVPTLPCFTGPSANVVASFLAASTFAYLLYRINFEMPEYKSLILLHGHLPACSKTFGFAEHFIFNYLEDTGPS